MLPENLDEDLLEPAGCCQWDAVLFLDAMFFSLLPLHSDWQLWNCAISYPKYRKKYDFTRGKITVLDKQPILFQGLIFCSLGSWADFSTSSYFLLLSCNFEAGHTEYTSPFLSYSSHVFQKVLSWRLALTLLGDKRASASSLSFIISGKRQLHCLTSRVVTNLSSNLYLNFREGSRQKTWPYGSCTQLLSSLIPMRFKLNKKLTNMLGICGSWNINQEAFCCLK